MRLCSPKTSNICPRNTKTCYSATLAVIVFCIGGATVFFYISLGPLRNNASCVLDRAWDLLALDDTPAAMAAALPESIIGPLRPHAPYLDLYIVALSLLACAPMVLAAFSLCISSKHFWLAKGLIGLSLFGVFLFLAVSTALLIVGLFSDRPLITEQWTIFSTFCDDARPALVNNASTGTQGNVTLVHFDALCDCLDSVPRSLHGQVTAAGIEIIALICGFYTLIGACCRIGCCRRARTNAVAPDEEGSGTKGAGPAKGEDLEVEDYDDDDEGDEDDVGATGAQG